MDILGIKFFGACYIGDAGNSNGGCKQEQIGY